MQISIKQLLIMVGFMALASLTSCKKLVEVKSPITTTSAELVFSSDATAAAVLTGIYASFNRFGINALSFNPGSISLIGGLSADEYKLHTGITANLFYYTNSL